MNNAGILEFGSIEDTSLDQYDRVMGVNVRSMYHLTMLAVPHLIVTRGNIVNVSSVNGLRSVSTYLETQIYKWSQLPRLREVASRLSPHIRLGNYCFANVATRVVLPQN